LWSKTRTHQHALSIFQGTTADENDTRKLVHTINTNLDTAPIAKERLDKALDKWWPDLAKELETASNSDKTEVALPKRGTDEMVAEVLELNRTMASEIRDITRYVEYEQNRRELEAALRPTLTLTRSATSRRSSLVEPLPPPPPDALSSLGEPPPPPPGLTPPPGLKNKS
jgi:hypothetical protein